MVPKLVGNYIKCCKRIITYNYLYYVITIITYRLIVIYIMS